MQNINTFNLYIVKNFNLHDTMMNKKKIHPIVKLILMSLILIFTISIFTAAGSILYSNNNSIIIFQLLAFILMGSVFTIYLYKQDKGLKIFGIRTSANKQSLLFYIPLMLIPFIQPVILGINNTLSNLSILRIILQMIAVGYTEELLFRGIYYYLLKERKQSVYIVFSSIVFGILHIANALNTSDIRLVLLQIIHALLLGVLLSVLYLQRKELVPLMMFHFLFNTLAAISNEGDVGLTVIIVSGLSIVYFVYLLLLVRRQRNAAI